jgi:hypothetical protein
MVGYCPDAQQMRAFDADAAGGENQWISTATDGRIYRQCDNYRQHQVCNWMIAQGDPEQLCWACRLNEVIPDLSETHNLLYWRKLEMAKRHMLYTVFALGLPLCSKQENPEQGLLFRFMTDRDPRSEFTEPLPEQAPVYTGHQEGEITINLAEADDVARTRARIQLGEGYRTLLGHFRHEIGHYYWTRLVAPKPKRLREFRQLFGDERQDYQAAQQRHYQEGAPANWAEHCISAYASMHPWEDWAESWAHTMHMIDTLETAQSFQLQIGDAPVPSVELPGTPAAADSGARKADRLINDWMRLAVGMNALNRSMGLRDAYPFVLTEPIRAKLRWVYQLMLAAAKRR